MLISGRLDEYRFARAQYEAAFKAWSARSWRTLRDHVLLLKHIEVAQLEAAKAALTLPHGPEREALLKARANWKLDAVFLVRLGILRGA